MNRDSSLTVGYTQVKDTVYAKELEKLDIHKNKGKITKIK